MQTVMFLWVCVCLHVCVCVCTHVYVYECMHACVCILVCACTYVHSYMSPSLQNQTWISVKHYTGSENASYIRLLLSAYDKRPEV